MAEIHDDEMFKIELELLRVLQDTGKPNADVRQMVKQLARAVLG